MTNCDKCNKEIGMLEKRYKYEDKEGNIIYYCSDCNSKHIEELRIKKQKKHQREVEKALKNNSKWEYKLVNFNCIGSGLNATGNKMNSEHEEKLNDLGQEGWELVNIVPMNSLAARFGASTTATEWVSCILRRKL